MGRKGFTLVELAIVLVIIGLLVGGVLAGQELIKQAKQRKLMKEFESILTAKELFYGKYQALAGDFNKASTFFSGTDGNNNKLIELIGAPTDDFIKVFEHLSKGGFIPGDFSAVTTGYTVTAGTHSMLTSTEDNAGFWMLDYNLVTLVGGHYENTSQRYLMVGRNEPNQPPVRGIMTPAEALEFDSKFDNGIPSTGTVTGGHSWSAETSGSTPCTSSASVYNTALTNKTCLVGIKLKR